MKEILPGVFHWRIEWPGLWPLESYWIRTSGGSVLIDPVECSGVNAIEDAADVAAIVVTVGWHERSARLFAKRTGAPVYVPSGDQHMLEDLDEYRTYGDRDELPCGLVAVGVPGLTPGEQALLAPVHGGTLFVGDALGTTGKWATGDMRLGGHPNGHPSPALTLSHLLDHEFENLLPGHGPAIIGGARNQLRELIESGLSTSSGQPRVTWFPRPPKGKPFRS